MNLLTKNKIVKLKIGETNKLDRTTSFEYNLIKQKKT